MIANDVPDFVFEGWAFEEERHADARLPLL